MSDEEGSAVPSYDIISADSHLEIPVDYWVDRVPDEHRHRAPRRIRLGNGGDAWLIEGQPIRAVGLDLCGRPYEEFMPTGRTYEGSPGAGPPEQRLAEQRQDGVDAEVLFPGVGGAVFWRSISSDEAYRSVIHAYNEFLADEYCAVDRDRLLGMGMIPETNLTDAIAELRFCAAHGLKGVTLNAYPSGKGYPTEEDDAFYREALDLGVALTVHVALQFLAIGNKGASFAYERRPDVEVSPEGRDPLKLMATWGIVGGFNAAQLVLSGVFERIPDFKIYFAETHAGWIPHFLEQLDLLYDRHLDWARKHYGLRAVDGRPSDLIKQHCYWGLVSNAFGVKIRHELGVDHVMWSTDFPHSESDWPRSREVMEGMFKDVPDDERRLMTRDNAMRYFSLA